MTDLLPPNSTVQERALSLSTARVGAVPMPIRQLWSPQTCPADILPWLAWSLSLDDWSGDWSEQQKRDAIAASVEVHRRKGTVGAVRRALQAIGYEVEIRESVDGPYTFSVYIDGSSGIVEEAAFSEAERLALANKNVRSHLSTVGTIIKTEGGYQIVSATLNGETTDVLPLIISLVSIDGKLVILSGMQDVVSTTIMPEFIFPDFIIPGTIFLPSGSNNKIVVELN